MEQNNIIEQNNNFPFKKILIISICLWIITLIGLIYVIFKINTINKITKTQDITNTNVVDTYLNFNFIKEAIRDAIKENEAQKVGGMDNYKLVEKMYQSEQFKNNQANSLKQAVAQFEGQETQQNNQQQNNDTSINNNQNNEDWFTRWKLETIQINTILQNAKFEGRANANTVLIEYSDIDCPFCQKHFSSKTIETIIKKYPDIIKTTFKHFPLGFHENAQKAAEAIECAWKQNKYIEFKNLIFKATIASNDKKPTEALLKKVAEYLKLDTTSFAQCLQNWETADKVKSDMSEWTTLFGITWTPGNVLLNIKTGKYVVVAGAYPAEQFDKLISELNQ